MKFEIEKLKEKYFKNSIPMDIEESNLKEKMFTSRSKKSTLKNNDFMKNIIFNSIELIQSIIYPQLNNEIFENFKQFRNLILFNLDEGFEEILNNIENQINCKFNLNNYEICFKNYNEMLNLNIIKKKKIIKELDNYLNNDSNFEKNLLSSKILNEKISIISSNLIQNLNKNENFKIIKLLKNNNILKNNKKVELFYDYFINYFFNNDLNNFRDYEKDVNNNLYLKNGIDLINNNDIKINYLSKKLLDNKNKKNYLEKNEYLLTNLGKNNYIKNKKYNDFLNFVRNLNTEDISNLVIYINTFEFYIENEIIYKFYSNKNFKINYHQIILSIIKFLKNKNISINNNNLIKSLTYYKNEILNYYVIGLNEFTIKYISSNISFNKKIKIINKILNMKIDSKNFEEKLIDDTVYKVVFNQEINELLDNKIIENIEDIIISLINKFDKKPLILNYIKNSSNKIEKISNFNWNKIFISLLYFLLPYIEIDDDKINKIKNNLNDLNDDIKLKIDKSIKNNKNLLEIYFKILSYNLLEKENKYKLLIYTFLKINNNKSINNVFNLFNDFLDFLILEWKNQLINLNSINRYKLKEFLKIYFYNENIYEINIDVNNYFDLSKINYNCIYYFKLILIKIKNNDKENFTKLLNLYKNNNNLELLFNEIFNYKTKSIIINFDFEIPYCKLINNFFIEMNDYLIDLINSLKNYKKNEIYQKIINNKNLNDFNKNIIFNIFYYLKKINENNYITKDILFNKIKFYYKYNNDFFSQFLLNDKIKNLDKNLKFKLVEEIKENLIKENKIELEIFSNSNFYEDDTNLLEILKKSFKLIIKNKKEEIKKIFDENNEPTIIFLKLRKLMKNKLKNNLMYNQYDIYLNIKLEYNKLNFEEKKKYLDLITIFLKTGKFKNLNNWKLKSNILNLYNNSKLIFDQINDEFRIKLKNEIDENFIKEVDFKDNFNYNVFNLIEYFFEIFFETFINNINNNKFKIIKSTNLGHFWRNIKIELKYYIILLIKKLFSNEKYDTENLINNLLFYFKFYKINTQTYYNIKEILIIFKKNFYENNLKYKLINKIINWKFNNNNKSLDKIIILIENFLINHFNNNNNNQINEFKFNYTYLNKFILNKLKNFAHNNKKVLITKIKNILENKINDNYFDDFINNLNLNDFMKYLLNQLLIQIISLTKIEKNLLKISININDDVNIIIENLYNIYLWNNKNKIDILEIYCKLIKENFSVIKEYFLKNNFKLEKQNIFLNNFLKILNHNNNNFNINWKSINNYKELIEIFISLFLEIYDENQNYQNFIDIKREKYIIKLFKNNLIMNLINFEYNDIKKEYIDIFVQYLNCNLKQKLIIINYLKNNRFINFNDFLNKPLLLNDNIFNKINKIFDYNELIKIRKENKDLLNELNYLKNQLNLHENYNNNTLLTEENIRDEISEKEEKSKKKFNELNLNFNILKKEWEVKNLEICNLKEKIKKLRKNQKSISIKNNNDILNEFNNFNKDNFNEDYINKFKFEIKKYSHNYSDLDINNIEVNESDINIFNKIDNIDELKFLYMDSIKLIKIYKNLLDKINIKYDELLDENNNNTDFIIKLNKKTEELYDEKHVLNNKLIELQSHNKDLKYKNNNYKEEINELNISIKDKTLELAVNKSSKLSNYEINENIKKNLKINEEINNNQKKLNNLLVDIKSFSKYKKTSNLYEIKENEDYSDNSDIENNKSMNFLVDNKNINDLDISDNLVENRKKKNSKNINIMNNKIIENYKNEIKFLKQKLNNKEICIFNEFKDIENYNFEYYKEFDNLNNLIIDNKQYKEYIIKLLNSNDNKFDKNELNSILKDLNMNDFNSFKIEIKNKRFELFLDFINSLKLLNNKIWELNKYINSISNHMKKYIIN